MTATIGGIEVPLIYSQELVHELVGTEGRTATGALRRNVFAYKREWHLQTRPITVAQRDALISHLEAVLFTAAEFWIDELGAETVQAFVEIVEERSVDLPDRRALTLVVSEV